MRSIDPARLECDSSLLCRQLTFSRKMGASGEVVSVQVVRSLYDSPPFLLTVKNVVYLQRIVLYWSVRINWSSPTLDRVRKINFVWIYAQILSRRNSSSIELLLMFSMESVFTHSQNKQRTGFKLEEQGYLILFWPSITKKGKELGHAKLLFVLFGQEPLTRPCRKWSIQSAMPLAMIIKMS